MFWLGCGLAILGACVYHAIKYLTDRLTDPDRVTKICLTDEDGKVIEFNKRGNTQ